MSDEHRVLREQSQLANPRVTRRAALLAGAGLAATVTIPTAAQQSTPSPSMATAPMSGFDVYVVGFHCAKEEPDLQMEAHHYCKMVDDGFFQCAIFDGNTDDAKLIGLEYIISEARFNALDEAEQLYWHPHNYEIFGGQLVAPTMEEEAELEFMRTQLLNSYGKTWHTWHTGRPDGQGQAGDELPVGPAMLQWSFNRDGEADDSLVESRNERLDIDMEAKREARQAFAGEAHPQEGVDALAYAFPDAAAAPPPGVEDSVNARQQTEATPEV
jgi:hypothetical protein